jgi:hypothetical protein
MGGRHSPAYLANPRFSWDFFPQNGQAKEMRLITIWQSGRQTSATLYSEMIGHAAVWLQTGNRRLTLWLFFEGAWLRSTNPKQRKRMENLDLIVEDDIEEGTVHM